MVNAVSKAEIVELFFNRAEDIKLCIGIDCFENEGGDISYIAVAPDAD